MTQYFQRYSSTRVGITDVVSLQGARDVVVSLDKENGNYTCQLVITSVAGANPRTESAWVSLTEDNTTDEVDIAVPDTATGIAVRVTAISGNEIQPRRGARMTVLLQQLLGLHQRRFYASGNQGDFPSGSPPPLTPPGPPQPPGTPFAWWDGADLSTMFQDVGGSTPTVNNGDLVRRIDNKGVGSSHNLVTGAGDVDVIWDSNFQNSLGGIHCTTAFAQISALIDASMTNGAWTMAVVGSVSVPAQITPIVVAAYKSFFQGFGVGPSFNQGDCFLVLDPVGAADFTDSNVASNQVFAMVASWQTGGQLDAICNISTQIKSQVNAPYVEPLIGDTTLIGGGGLSSDVKVGDYVVWDSLIDFNDIKQYHLDKWALTYV